MATRQLNVLPVDNKITRKTVQKRLQVMKEECITVANAWEEFSVSNTQIKEQCMTYTSLRMNKSNPLQCNVGLPRVVILLLKYSLTITLLLNDYSFSQ